MSWNETQAGTDTSVFAAAIEEHHLLQLKLVKNLSETAGWVSTCKCIFPI